MNIWTILGIAASTFLGIWGMVKYVISQPYRLDDNLSKIVITLSILASLIHDQLSLPKQGASTEEILLQKEQLATSYSYSGTVGISYTFGSIYNNIVNPRF